MLSGCSEGMPTGMAVGQAVGTERQLVLACVMMPKIASQAQTMCRRRMGTWR